MEDGQTMRHIMSSMPVPIYTHLSDMISIPYAFEKPFATCWHLTDRHALSLARALVNLLLIVIESFSNDGHLTIDPGLGLYPDPDPDQTQTYTYTYTYTHTHTHTHTHTQTLPSILKLTSTSASQRPSDPSNR